ncbi:glycoside hydrolase family 3 protein [bacterium M00.F.Ca.ET.230.01.1.1]|nr:glycoside hydrolase family 3 protein [bacterium M00.F.Ca.ET.230.01.1.1]
MDEIARDAYAVLLPAFERADFTDASRSFFDAGGVASLLGSTREEYVARRMSRDRQQTETRELLFDYHNRARSLAGDVLIAIDYELGGVHRLHKLAPQLPHPREVLEMKEAEIEHFGVEAARAARACGINFFLAPVLDLVTGSNPWLRDRTFSADADLVSRVTSAFIRGVQSQGVAATAKHFPGHPHVPEDPHDSASATVTAALDDLKPNLRCFDAAIAAGVRAIMTGPIPVDAIDPGEPSSTSAKVVALLRETHRFQGLIVSDDLDLAGTLRGRTVAETAVASLKAGVDLLLLASGPQVDEVASYIIASVQTGNLRREVVARAASGVRRLASDAGRCLQAA